MCECSDYIGGFVFMSLFALFIAILAYKHGFCSGEAYAFKRFDRICNVCRNKK